MAIRPLIRLKASIAFTALAVALLFVFQNCGGGDSSGDVGSFLDDTPEIKKYKAAPFPYDVNFNQIAYMTCPMVAPGQERGVEDLDNPFFTLRGGAYDNRSLAARFPQHFPALQEPERSYRLKAGVGLKKDFVEYLKTNFDARLQASPGPDGFKKLLLDSLSGGGFDLQPMAALVFRLRSSQGFAWDANHAKLTLTSLAENNTANQLISGMDMGQYGVERVNYLTGVGDISQRSMVVSVNAGKDEAVRDFIKDQMGTNLQFVAGLAESGGEASVFMLKSPDDNNKTLHGRVYRLGTGRLWPGRIDYAPQGNQQVAFQASSITDDFIDTIQELDTSKSFERDLTVEEQQQWSCFSLMIVRDGDRRDPITGKFFDPDYDPSLWSGNKKNKYYDFQASPTTPIIPGVRVACPPQEIGDGSRPGTLNYMGDGGLARLRLEVARRFLPADLWEINTNPEYMCAVPRPTAQTLGQCYAAGDFNASQYVMYTQQGVELGRQVQCGRNPTTGELQKECPAFVSICYRTH